MSKLKELLQEKALELLLLGLAGALGSLLTIVWKEISAPLIQKVLPSISTIAWASVTSILFLMLSMTWVYILLTRKKSRKYRHDKHLGIHFHKKTGDPFCSSCMALNIESPMMESERGWKCHRKDCDSFRANPDYKPPSPPPKPETTPWVKGR
jgi:hypothetical protein